MITSLKELNKILFRGVFLSKYIDHSTIYAPLKGYIGTDWSKLEYHQRNKYEEYSESFIFTNDLIQKLYYKNIYKNEIINNNSLTIKLIKWNPYYEGPIHGHNNNHCYFKVVNGSLNEIINTNSNMKVENYYQVQNIGYISDTVGQHKIKNLSNDYSYSLHIYFKNNIIKNYNDETNHLLFEEQAKTLM